MQNKPLSILIGGDLVINKPYELSNIDPNLIALFKKSDFNIINLEAPITKSTSKILKTGPHLKSDEKGTLNVLKELEVDLVTLANNHVLDYGEQGVEDTLKFCSSNSIQTVGAGKNLKEASKTLYIDSKEGKIAIVNFAENEWSSATEITAGANPMDIIDNASQIKEAKKQASFVFVIVHGGHEYYNLPSPRMQKQYRFYAEQGADIVIGHHTHCINGNEVYNGVPIYYSLGNFLFTQPSIYNDWYTGLILEVNIVKGELKSELRFIRQQKETYQLEILSSTEKEVILERLANYNEIINDEVKLKENWTEYVKEKYSSYLNLWSPLFFINSRYIRAVFLKLKLRLINKQGMALTLNLMRCEAHADMSREAITKYLSK